MRAAIIFDLDGTLWDSTDTIAPAWDRVLSRAGRRVTREDMTSVMGMTDREIGAALLPELDGEESTALVRLASREEVPFIRRYGGRLYPGVADTLRRLAQEYDLFIVSNCMDGYIQAFLYAHSMGQYFRDYACLGFPAQDKAANIRAVCEKYALKRAVYVGDTASDGRAARLAGLPFFHATYGFGETDGADGVLREFSALPALLNTFWNGRIQEEKTMRDYREETEKRVQFIRERLAESGAKGIVYGNSGGKDSALVGILCKLACENTVGVTLPCESKRNFGEDMADGLAVAEQYRIETRNVDITPVKQALVAAVEPVTELNRAALTNMNPRLRMTVLYAVGAAENRLVAGTGNRSERYMGYFTKWGDGACDFNPIGDLTVAEVYDFLRYLNAPENIIRKAPSAGLFEGQTDEQEMGVSYAAIDRVVLGGEVSEKEKAIIDRYHSRSEHKRKLPPIYGE